MAGYTKVFASLLHSTVWQTSAPTRLVWITMLVLSDRDGLVEASIPGLARAANVSLEECEEALESFLSPDKYSRTPDNDGRRIEKCVGGWRLLNYEKYSELKSSDDVREKAAQRQARWRNRHPEKVTPVTLDVTLRNAQSRSVTPNNTSGSGSSQADLKQDTDTEARASGLWSAADWRKCFEAAWCRKYQQIAMGGGDASAKATGVLHDAIAELDGDARLAAQARSGAMFAEFLGDESPAVVKARHMWSWFVARFNALRVPALPMNVAVSFDERRRRDAADAESRRREAEKNASAEARRIVAELERSAK